MKVDSGGTPPSSDNAGKTVLRREITLPLLVLYGLGVTIGAGIYVLVGTTAARAGAQAPSAFIIAAIVMLFSACSFSELSGRFPQSAGEAVYVEAGFRWAPLTTITGLLLLFAAVVSAAAITVGSAGYIATLIPLPNWGIIVLIVAFSCTMACWGIVESLTFAATLTLVEILGLVAVVIAGFWTQPQIISALPSVFPSPVDLETLANVFYASLIAFFAFIGFDGMVNIVEETKKPARTMPLGILLTLTIATILYFCVSAVAVLTLPVSVLSESEAPISLMFQSLTGISPLAITLIAIGATMNGIVIQIILGSRVLYGLANVGRLPAALATLNAQTQTPILATILISFSTLACALFFPLDILAERTTQVVLFVFILINLALIRIKWRKDKAPAGIFIVPIVIPVIGFVTCMLLLCYPLFVAR